MSDGGGVAVVVAFDVDRTLTTRDCVVPFLSRFMGPRPLWRSLVYLPHIVVSLVRRDRDRLKSVATDVALRGVTVDRLDTAARDLAAVVAAQRLRPDTTARLQWHREAGHRVVLVSASYAVYLDHLGVALGADAVLGTLIEVDGDGLCTGRLVGANCRAGEKRRRLVEWLDAEGLERDDVVIWAYGDSRGDRELLAWADHPVWARETLDSVAPTA
jgi:phosphatidylglycerophosphatase C